MSTIPSRTRSLRKPPETGSRFGRSTAADASDKNAAILPTPAERTSKSPSRLPTVRTTASRPPSLYGRPSSSSGSSSTTSSKLSPCLPSANSILSKTTATDLQRRPSIPRHAPPPTTTEPVKKDRSKPPLTQSRHLRNTSTSSISSLPSASRISGHTRTKSSSTLLTSSTTLRLPSQEPSLQQAPTRLLRSESLSKKPTFSTHQQHFSPAKNLAPKPHPAAFLAPPSPSKLPSNIAISAETAKFQNELLQLHLLHRDAESVNQEWKASAKQKLGKRFREVVQRNDDLVQLEVGETGKVNASVLRKWQEEGQPGWGIDEKIQVLDDVITGVWNLGEHGGKYARQVRKFERWLSRCQGILAARENGANKGDFVFLEEMEASWRDDCLNISRKLESWKQGLHDLGNLEKGSSLSTVVENYRILVRGMIEELSAMAGIEKDMMTRERNWIEAMNNEHSEDDSIQTAGACWRAT